MKKIKKYIKRHFKKIATVFCVIISIFVFSLSSYADPAIRDTQFDFVQMQLYKNSNHDTVTVRGYNPITAKSFADDYDDNSWQTPIINNRHSAVFKFADTEKLNIYFSNQLIQRFPKYKNGFMYTEFDILFAGKSIEYLEVIGYQIGQGFSSVSGHQGTFQGTYVNTYSTLVTFSPTYDFVNVSRSNGTYVSPDGTKYSSYVFHVSLTVPIRYQYDVVYVSLTLGFDGTNTPSNTAYYMRNFYGWQYYSDAYDIPSVIKGLANEEVNDIQKENEITDQLLDGVGEGTNAYKEILGGLSNGAAFDLLTYMQYAGALAAPIMEIPRMEVILRLALITGVFTLVFSITSHVYGFYESKAHPDKPKNTSTKTNKKG